MIPKTANTMPEIVKINSRFGEFDVDLSKSISFPKGIIGFVPNLNFVILDFLKPEMANFKILQCTNDHSVSFPVLPIGFENSLIDSADMNEILTVSSIKKENIAVLLIVSSLKRPDGVFDIFANVKAPVVIDISSKTAFQHVFSNSKYSVKQRL